jgi:hypothetical protein
VALLAAIHRTNKSRPSNSHQRHQYGFQRVLDQPPSLQTPAWATQCWDPTSSPSPGPSSPPLPPSLSGRYGMHSCMPSPVPVIECAREWARDEQYGHRPGQGMNTRTAAGWSRSVLPRLRLLCLRQKSGRRQYGRAGGRLRGQRG